MARNRIVYFNLLLLSLLFFVLFDLYLVHLLFVFFLVLPVFSLLFALPCCLSLRCRMESADDIVPKGGGALRLTAENKSIFPCACVCIRLARRNALGRAGKHYAESGEETVQFLLGPGRRQTITPSLHTPHCGRIDVSVVRMDACDMLGLFRLPVPKRNIDCRAGSVYVLPALQSRTVDTEDTADLGLDSVTYSTKKAGSDPSEIFQLRDYRPGDSFHSVHRKLSSRMDRLIVREFGLPLNPSLHFLLELRTDAYDFAAGIAAAEELLSAVLAFSEYLMARKAVHSLSWLSEEGALRTVAVTGPDALASALHELLALPAQPPWRTLGAFAAQAGAQPDTHLLYLIAGAEWDKKQDADAERLLDTLLARGVCGKLTLMPDACAPQDAERLRALGCGVQLLNGSIPGAETENV